jgi:hypothetical protein
MITLVARSRCPMCGCWQSSYAYPSVRVNKCSLRQLRGQYLTCAPGRCPECGHGSWPGAESYRATPWRLDAESAAEVESYRARKWPS